MLDRFERFVSTMSEIHRYFHKIMSEEMHKYELKGSYAIYLVMLYRHVRLTVTQLGELCERNKADVSRAVADFEKRGLAFRLSNEHSGNYRAQIGLTEKGLRAAETLSERAKSVVNLAGSGLADKERDMFYHALETISRNMRNICEEQSNATKN